MHTGASNLMTTFSTPFGRYRYLRLPFGISASSDLFQLKYNEIFEGLPGVTAIVDNILIYGRTREGNMLAIYGAPLIELARKEFVSTQKSVP